MRALFISDLHLCEEHPEITRAFLSLVEGPAREVDELYILGDLFEYWAGDDDDTPLARRVCAAIRALSDEGARVFFIAGNRDFLIGRTFAERAGFRILNDPQEITLDGCTILLSHGDALCTDDVAYQEYRTQVRSESFRKTFLAKPLEERKEFIESLRAHSMRAKSEKSMDIMDVNPESVAELFRSHGYPVLIHGHTHRPARHLHDVDGKECVRWVLSDWRDDSAPCLLWNGVSLETVRYEPPD